MSEPVTTWSVEVEQKWSNPDGWPKVRQWDGSAWIIPDTVTRTLVYSPDQPVRVTAITALGRSLYRGAPTIVRSSVTWRFASDCPNWLYDLLGKHDIPLDVRDALGLP